MRITRLVAGTVTAGLIGVTPIAISAPAHADGQTYTPVITATLNISNAPYEAPYMYGGGFYVSGTVTDPSGVEGPSGGTASLQVLTSTNPAWTTIAVDESPSSLFFDGEFRFTENAQYKVVYPGAAASSAYEDTFLAGESVAMSAPVARKVVFANPKGTLIKGKVTPDYAKKKIVIQVSKKEKKGYKKFKTIKTNKKGKYKVIAKFLGSENFKTSKDGSPVKKV